MGANGNTATVEVDSATLKTLDELSAKWGLSREQAAKRAIEQAAPQNGTGEPSHKLDAFRKLQSRLALSSEKANAWQAAVRDARR